MCGDVQDEHKQRRATRRRRWRRRDDFDGVDDADADNDHRLAEGDDDETPARSARGEEGVAEGIAPGGGRARPVCFVLHDDAVVLWRRLETSVNGTIHRWVLFATTSLALGLYVASVLCEAGKVPDGWQPDMEDGNNFWEVKERERLETVLSKVQRV